MTVFFLVFVLFLVLCVTITSVYLQVKSRMEHALMEQLVLEKSNKINTVISKLLYKTQIIAALVTQNGGKFTDFSKFAAPIVDDPAIKNIIFAPDGIVQYVYPLEGNEAVLGLDYFKSGAGNSEAVEARESGELVLGGPFTLVQGGQALVGRLPVYIEENGVKRFFGLASVTLYYPLALNGAELDQLQNRNLGYEIWRVSPETGEKQIISRSPYGFDKNARFVERPLNILNASWFFRLAPIRAWYQFPETWIFLGGGLILSFLAAFLALNNHDLKHIKSELEFLTYNDPLTGILNRRGFFSEMSRLIRINSAPFVLSYLDLDNFKQVNDTFGHGVGNLLLEEFVNEIKKRLNTSHIFARIGGDEFVLVFKNTENKTAAADFFAEVRESLKNDASLDECGICEVPFSAGHVSFPSDSQVLTELISLADSAMYEDKTLHRTICNTSMPKKYR